PGDGHPNFGELGQAMRSLAESEPGPIELHLFSDMQRTAMPSNFSEAVLPNNVELKLHPVADGPASANWTVESVEAPATLSDPKDRKHSRVRPVIAGSDPPDPTQAV